VLFPESPEEFAMVIESLHLLSMSFDLAGDSISALEYAATSIETSRRAFEAAASSSSDAPEWIITFLQATGNPANATAISSGQMHLESFTDAALILFRIARGSGDVPLTSSRKFADSADWCPSPASREFEAISCRMEQALVSLHDAAGMAAQFLPNHMLQLFAHSNLATHGAALY
jgi:hypothetical protein